MLARFLLGLLADLVFESAATNGRSYAAELDRYLAQRGMVPTARPAKAV